MELQLASTKITRGTSNGFNLKAFSTQLLAEANPESNLGRGEAIDLRQESL